eukprot:929464-Rhodomonas_salina.1
MVPLHAKAACFCSLASEFALPSRGCAAGAGSCSPLGPFRLAVMESPMDSRIQPDHGNCAEKCEAKCRSSAGDGAPAQAATSLFVQGGRSKAHSVLSSSSAARAAGLKGGALRTRPDGFREPSSGRGRVPRRCEHVGRGHRQQARADGTSADFQFQRPPPSPSKLAAACFKTSNQRFAPTLRRGISVCLCAVPFSHATPVSGHSIGQGGWHFDGIGGSIRGFSSQGFMD